MHELKLKEMAEAGESTLIASAPAPASPTEEELSAAKAWELSHSESDDE